jgi:nucleolar protein 56
MPQEVYVHFTPLGVILSSDEKNIMDVICLFKDKTPNELAQILYSIENASLPDDVLDKVFSKFSDGKDYVLILEDEDLARRVSQKFPSLNIRVAPSNKVHRAIRLQQVEIISKKCGVSPEEYYNIVWQATNVLSRLKVREKAEKRDLYIAQAVNALDDINKTINLFASRVREWYSLHFPELNDIVEDHEDYFKIVSKIGGRNEITKEALEKLGFKEDVIKKIVDAASSSMGAELTSFDLEALRLVSDIGLQLYDARRKLEKYIDEAMYEVAPNIRGIVGSVLGARLISLAGGLEKLARMPASTIQVLGAEKALFRALRFGAKPPKHGVIFQHPYIHKAPKWQRGKIARALAGKLAIAARIDAFTGEYRADELREDLEKRIEEIKTLYAKPPAKPPRPPKKEGHREGHGKKFEKKKFEKGRGERK